MQRAEIANDIIAPSANPRPRGYGRARLWLVITAVGSLVMLCTLGVVFDVASMVQQGIDSGTMGTITALFLFCPWLCGISSALRPVRRLFSAETFRAISPSAGQLPHWPGALGCHPFRGPVLLHNHDLPGWEVRRDRRERRGRSAGVDTQRPDLRHFGASSPHLCGSGSGRGVHGRRPGSPQSPGSPSSGNVDSETRSRAVWVCE
jgi:hypothetical protein